MRKRWRVVRAKHGELRASYGRGEYGSDIDIQYAWGGGASKPDARILCNALEEYPVYDGRSLVKELEARGYDIATLRFSIQRLPTLTTEQDAQP
jgi:hypothetical protein